MFWYNRDNYEMQIKIVLTFLYRSIDIIMGHY